MMITWRTRIFRSEVLSATLHPQHGIDPLGDLRRRGRAGVEPYDLRSAGRLQRPEEALEGSAVAGGEAKGLLRLLALRPVILRSHVDAVPQDRIGGVEEDHEAQLVHPTFDHLVTPAFEGGAGG